MPGGTFSVNIKSAVRIVAPVATRKQRLWLGNELLRIVRSRIQSVKDVNDSTAKPLTVKYAIQKSKRRGRNRRDLTDSGEMLASLRVSQASANRIVISPEDEKSKRKLAYNQAKCEQWGISPRDTDAINARAEEVWIRPAMAVMLTPALVQSGRFYSSVGAVFGRQ